MALLHAFREKLAVLMFVARYRARMIRLAFVIKPIAGGAPDDDDGGDDDSKDDSGDDAVDKDADDKDDASDEDDDSKDDDDKPAEPNWKQMARKHEREAKKLRKEQQQLSDRLKAREDQDKSEQDKAIEAAEQRATDKLKGDFDRERRADRLELATTKIAAKGLKIGSGDDAKTVRFADPDDAMVYLERAIARDEIDGDDIFDDKGRVRSDQLEEALADLLERKPHLAAGDKPAAKVQGDADGRKGTPAKGDESVADHFKKIRRHKDGQPAHAVQVGRPAG